jgi:hypothetical protein
MQKTQKKLTFLFVYDSFTGGFIVTFPYIHILSPGLVHPLHYSPSSPTLTLTGFNVPYSYMNKKYLNHIQPPLPSSITSPPPLMPSLSHDLCYTPVLQCVNVSSLLSGLLPWYFTCKYVVLQSV